MESETTRMLIETLKERKLREVAEAKEEMIKKKAKHQGTVFEIASPLGLIQTKVQRWYFTLSIHSRKRKRKDDSRDGRY